MTSSTVTRQIAEAGILWRLYEWYPNLSGSGLHQYRVSLRVHQWAALTKAFEGPSEVALPVSLATRIHA